jgi:phage terminase small subunit
MKQDGCSEARPILKEPSEKDRLKAAELLGKRYGICTEKVQDDVMIPVPSQAQPIII